MNARLKFPLKGIETKQGDKKRTESEPHGVYANGLFVHGVPRLTRQNENNTNVFFISIRAQEKQIDNDMSKRVLGQTNYTQFTPKKKFVAPERKN